MSFKARLAVIPPVATALFLLLLAAAAAVAIAGSMSPAPLPSPTGLARNGAIVFDSLGDLYLMDPDGTNVRAITSGPELDSSGVFSPDGTHIAFWSTDHGRPVVAVTDAEGAGHVLVSGDVGVTHDAQETASWSPDGRAIVFVGVVDGKRALAIAASDGSSLRTIDVGDVTPRYPVWSPTGDRIAYRGDGPVSDQSRSGIFVVDPDGSHTLRIAATANYVRGWSPPSWSPDGTQVAYDVIVPEHVDTMDIAVSMADGSGTRVLGADPLDECCVAWSPDGAMIAYLKGTYPGFGPTGAWEYDMFLVAPDGSGLRQLGGPDALRYEPGPPIWSPDGTRILDYGIFDFDPAKAYPNIIVTVDGSAPAIVVPAPNSVGPASWQRLAP